jgi:hypothetical protein
MALMNPANPVRRDMVLTDVYYSPFPKPGSDLAEEPIMPYPA